MHVGAGDTCRAALSGLLPATPLHQCHDFGGEETEIEGLEDDVVDASRNKSLASFGSITPV